MKSKDLFITDEAYFDNTALKNPINTLDHKLKEYFPNLYCAHYDTRLLATKAPTEIERQIPGYNNYRERFATDDIRSLDDAIIKNGGKNIYLCGFTQQQFEYIVPKIMNTAEIIYFSKCPRIRDLSMLSDFPKLTCVHIYWNISLESFWDMSNNKNLKVISFQTVSKIRNVDAFKNSYVEYVCLDSSGNYPNTKKILFDPAVFDAAPHLKHLTLWYTGCRVDY